MQHSLKIWKKLREKDLVEGKQPIPTLGPPWYMMLLLSLSGWFGALFLVIFTGGVLILILGVDVDRYPGTLGWIGAGLVFFSYRMFREKQSEFVAHFILALSIAGQAMIIFSLFFIFRESMEGSIYVLIVIFQAFLIWLIPNTMHRMFSSFFMALSFSLFFYTLGEFLVPIMLLTFSVAWLWINEFSLKGDPKWEAVAYGQTAALFCLKYASLFVPYSSYMSGSSNMDRAALFTTWFLHLGTFLTLAYIVWKILQENHRLDNRKVRYLSFTAVVVLGALSIEMNGLVLSIILLLIGFAHSHHLLTGFGIVNAFAFFSYYYYAMGATLMEKSGLLAILGAGLILSRFLMRYLLKEEHTHV